MMARMRFMLFAAVVLVAGCATSAPVAPDAAGISPATVDAAPSRTALMLQAAGGASAPTRAEVERLLGRADIARQDGAGAALTYRLESCALLLLFAADSHNALRLAEAHPSARHSGEAAPTIERCASEADARVH